MAEDLGDPLRADFCDLCGLTWPCLCDPAHPRTRPTEAELEAARRSRLARAELEREQKGGPS